MRLVFISSTFKDMQSERDQMHNRVLPLVDAELEKYGESLNFADLRWGVNTKGLSEEESSRKVLSLCLDRIDDCKPYMIVFIGERYGWIPEKKFLDEICRQKEIDIDDYNGSVTELEIEYGALLHPDFEGRILFYFRDEFDTSKMSEEEKKIYCVESSLHKEKIERLKRKIEELYPSYIRHYQVEFDEEKRSLTGFDKLNKMVQEDLLRIFQIDIEKESKISPQEKKIRNSHNYLVSYAKYKVITGEESTISFETNDLDINDGSTYTYVNNPLVFIVHGESGRGVKTQVSLAYYDSLDYENVNTIPLVLHGESKKEISGILIYKLEDFLNKKHSNKNSSEYLLTLLEEYDAKDDYLYIFVTTSSFNFIDLLLEIEALQDMEKKFFTKIRFYIGYKGVLKQSEHIPYYFFSNNVELNGYKGRIKRKILNSLLEKQKKELSKKVIDKILKKEESIEPLYLSLIVDRLCKLDEFDFREIKKLGDGMDAIEEYMLSIVNKYGDNLEEIINELFSELCQRINKITIPYFIALLSYEKVFNLYAIEKFMKYYSLPYEESDFILFTKLYPSLFERKEGEFYSYSCDLIKNEAKEFKENHLPSLDEKVLVFLESLERKSKFFIKAYPSYLVESKDKKRIINTFIDLSKKFDEDRNDQASYDLYNSMLKSFSNLVSEDYDLFILIFYELIELSVKSIDFNSRISFSDMILYSSYGSTCEQRRAYRRLIKDVVNLICQKEEYLNNKKYCDFAWIICNSVILTDDVEALEDLTKEELEKIKYIYNLAKDNLSNKEVFSNNRVFVQQLLQMLYSINKDRYYQDNEDNTLNNRYINQLNNVFKTIEEEFETNKDYLDAIKDMDNDVSKKNYVGRNQFTYLQMLSQRGYMYLLDNKLEEAKNDALLSFKILMDYCYKYIGKDTDVLDISISLKCILYTLITYYESKNDDVKVVNLIQDSIRLINRFLYCSERYYASLLKVMPCLLMIFFKGIIPYNKHFTSKYISNYIQFLLKSLKPYIVDGDMEIDGMDSINVLFKIINKINYNYVDYDKLLRYFLEIFAYSDAIDERLEELEELLTIEMLKGTSLKEEKEYIKETFNYYFYE